MVPAIRIGNSYLTEGNNRLRITLQLPSRPVEILATSLHFEHSANGSIGEGYLLGVRIIKMNKEDGACYREYLSAFGNMKKEAGVCKDIGALARAKFFG